MASQNTVLVMQSVHAILDTSQLLRDVYMSIAERSVASACDRVPTILFKFDSHDSLVQFLEKLEAGNVSTDDMLGIVSKDRLRRASYEIGMQNGFNLEAEKAMAQENNASITRVIVMVDNDLHGTNLIGTSKTCVCGSNGATFKCSGCARCYYCSAQCEADNKKKHSPYCEFITDLSDRADA